MSASTDTNEASEGCEEKLKSNILTRRKPPMLNKNKCILPSKETITPPPPTASQIHHQYSSTIIIPKKVNKENMSWIDLGDQTSDDDEEEDEEIPENKDMFKIEKKKLDQELNNTLNKLRINRCQSKPHPPNRQSPDIPSYDDHFFRNRFSQNVNHRRFNRNRNENNMYRYSYNRHHSARRDFRRNNRNKMMRSVDDVDVDGKSSYIAALTKKSESGDGDGGKRVRNYGEQRGGRKNRKRKNYGGRKNGGKKKFSK